MKFEFYDMASSDITTKVVLHLADQGVCMDDWDYMLFFETKYKREFPKEWDCGIEPRNYNVQQLLRGCCSNKWYVVDDFLGRKGFLGVAYHS